MPPSSVQINPDRIAPEAAVEMTQSLQKSFPVSSLRADHPVAFQKRRHPTREIKPLLMLTGSGDAKRMSPLRSSLPQLGTQRKARLILEDNRFPRSQILKFFLTPGEIALLLPQGLEGRHNLPSLSDTPVDASRSVLAALSISTRTGASNARPEWGRPNEPDPSQNPAAIGLSAFLPPERSEASSERAVPVWVCSSEPLVLRHLRLGPIDSSSYASALKPEPSSWAAA